MKVDHLAQVPNQNTDCFGGYCSNAATLGDPQGKGAQSFWFAMADTQGPVGMATDKRAVLHEFGHALLYETLNCANFKFAHSAGDSLAAISSDPLSKLTDHLHRFATFPWVEDVSNPNSRRHDRKILDGWGWDADNDNHDISANRFSRPLSFVLPVRRRRRAVERSGRGSRSPPTGVGVPALSHCHGHRDSGIGNGVSAD